MSIYNVIFSIRAQKNLSELLFYIQTILQTPKAADEQLHCIRDATYKLRELPQAAHILKTTRTVRDAQIYWLPVKNYRIYYRIDEDAKVVYILAILHARTDTLRALGDVEIDF